jgi:type IV pilus assembly protein PilA
MGFSSVPDGTGFFRNRAFLYTPEPRQGLLAGLGGKSGPFTHVNLAPADADVYLESEVDVPVVYRTIKEVVAKVGGETSSNKLEDGLKKAGESMALSVLDLIGAMKGRSAIVLRLNPDHPVQLPGPSGVKLPLISMLVCVDGVGAPVDLALQQSKAFGRTVSGTVHIYTLNQQTPVEGLKPAVLIDGSTLYLATSMEFLNECRGQKEGLAQTPAFRQALTEVGSEGNGLNYISPRFFSALHQVEKLNPQMPEQLKSTLHWVMASLPMPDRPLVTVRTNLPDGILIRSYWNRSLKQDVMMVAVYNPLTIGIVAAMAVPAFQKVRSSSQEKAVLNNLRQLAAAADQYYLEHGVTTATYTDLVGPDKYVKTVTSVAGENYHLLRFQAGRPLQVRLSDGRTIHYP